MIVQWVLTEYPTPALLDVLAQIECWIADRTGIEADDHTWIAPVDGPQ